MLRLWTVHGLAVDCCWVLCLLQILPQLVDGGQPEEEEMEGAADEFDLREVLAEEVTAPITSKEEQLRQVGAGWAHLGWSGLRLPGCMLLLAEHLVTKHGKEP